MKHSIWIPTVLGTVILAACGGGGSADTLDTPVTAAALTLTGVAATGAAIGGKTVEAKCNSGTGSATSNDDGSYNISVESGSLPCVLKVTPDSGPALYSVATGTGSSATANINPVTQLVMARLTGTDPDAYFTSFDSSAAAAVTDTKVTDAVAATKATLLAAGLDLGSIDVLAGTLTAATKTTTGNVYDQALDALAAKLASAGTTLATLTSTVAASSTTPSATATAATSGTPSLPADMLLKPAASQCAALRSGTYRIVNPAQATSLADQTGAITINAETLAVTYTDGSTGAWAASTEANGACHFTDDAGMTDIVVSPAGVLVARHVDADGAFRVGIGFPEQSHTLAELAGTWNAIGLASNDGNTAFTAATLTATLDDVGGFSAATWCHNDTTWNLAGADCNTVTDGLSTLKANATAGFDSFDPGHTTVDGRVFVYRAGGGELMAVGIDNDGSLMIYTKKRTNALPTVGAVSTSWSITLNSQLLASNALSTSSNTIASVDTAAGSWVRTQHSAGGTAFDYSEELAANNPRDGFTYRPTATATAVGGTSVNVREFFTLGLRGMGVSPVVIPSTKSFVFSVNQP